MPSADNIAIYCVPPNMFGAVWPSAGDWILRGLATAPNIGVFEAIDACRSGQMQLWVIAQQDPAEIVGACLTELVEHEGAKVVAAYAMAGRNWRDWADQLCARMVDYARAEGRTAVRFAGRRGWMRVFSNIREVSASPTGEPIFERAV